MKGIWAVATIAVLQPQSVTAPHQTNAHAREQVEFSMETDIVPIAKPIVPPEPLTGALRKDSLVAKVSRPCAKGADSSSVEIPASWFVASKLRLAGPDEDNFVILPENDCMMGANVGPFWIAQAIHGNYRIILSTSGHDLRVLPRRHKGHKDVEIISATAVMVSTVVFRFDGHMYRKFSAKTSTPE